MASFGWSNLGKTLGKVSQIASDVLPFDPTPGFNLSTSGGWGVPFVQHSGGSPTGSNLQVTQGGTVVPGGFSQSSNQRTAAETNGSFSDGSQPSYDASLLDDFNTQKGNIFNTAQEAGSNFGAGYKNSILDYLDNLRTGQQGLDTQGARNELARMQGVSGVLGSVGRNIRSSGVALANRNAGDSSAAEALARAYGDVGKRSLSNVGNQYEMGNEDLKMAQADFNTQQAAGSRRLDTGKTQAVNQIVADARDKFAQLDAYAADKSLPERIAIEQEKEKVRSQVLEQLQQYDQLLQEESAKVAPTNIDQRRAEAQRLQGLGTDLGADAFNFTTETPGQFQNTGPFASELPIFTMPRRRTA